MMGVLIGLAIIAFLIMVGVFGLYAFWMVLMDDIDKSKEGAEDNADNKSL